jgi:hypothetical protein
MILHIAENATEATARKHPEIARFRDGGGRDMANWFVVKAPPGGLALEVERLHLAGRQVYEIDTEGGHLAPLVRWPQGDERRHRR